MKTHKKTVKWSIYCTTTRHLHQIGGVNDKWYSKHKTTFKHDHIQVISTWYLLWKSFFKQIHHWNHPLQWTPTFARWARSPSSAPKTLNEPSEGVGWNSPMAHWSYTGDIYIYIFYLYIYTHRCVYWKHISHSCTHARVNTCVASINDTCKHMCTFVCTCVNMDIGTWMDVGNFCNPSDSKNMWCS